MHFLKIILLKGKLMGITCDVGRVTVPGKKRYTYYVHVSEDDLKVCTSLSLSYTQIACNSAMCIICNHFCKYTSPDR